MVGFPGGVRPAIPPAPRSAARPALAWLAILLIVALEIGLRPLAPEIGMLIAFPLLWLAVHSGRRSLLAAVAVAVMASLVALLLIPDDIAAPVAAAVASLLAILLQLHGGRADDAARFTSLAYTDFLTNCPNRRAWDHELPERLTTAREREVPLAVAVIDLDRFSAYNEDWGHVAGDRLLTDVATVLRFSQSTDPEASGLRYIARIGADEFALLVEGLTTAAASGLIGDLEADLPAGATLTVGIAVWDRRETAEELLHRALRALAAAGRTMGGARVVVDEGAGSRPGSWLESVPAIVARGQVQSVYQPIRDLARGSLVGYEALARPVGSPPETEVDGMFSAARRLGVAMELENLCQTAALAGAHRLLARGGSLFINVSIGSLTEDGLEAMLRQMRGAGVRPQQVVLEVNEQVTRLGRFAEACALYRRAGFRFAMDDVGEGLSTIEAIAVVRPEIIKIAKGLVSSADEPGSAAVIRGLVETAQALDGRIIAEGIETPADSARMLALGATLGQGWALGAPAPLHEALQSARREPAAVHPVSRAPLRVLSSATASARRAR
jgi:diguanylate cyclase (GGDEF)-like protein